MVKSIPTRPVTTIFTVNCGSLDYGSVFQWSITQLLEREPCLHRLHQSLAWRMASLTLSEVHNQWKNQATWLQNLHLFLEPNHSTPEICHPKPFSYMPAYWSIMNHHHRSQHPWPSIIRLPAIARANPWAPSKGGNPNDGFTNIW